MDDILGEKVVAQSYWLDALIAVEDLIIRHGYPKEPNLARVRSFRGTRNEDVLLARAVYTNEHVSLRGSIPSAPEWFEVEASSRAFDVVILAA